MTSREEGRQPGPDSEGREVVEGSAERHRPEARRVDEEVPEDLADGRRLLVLAGRAFVETPALRLFESQTPRTVENFVGLATGQKEWQDDDGNTQSTPFYDGTIIHRVVPEFRIHLGCPKGNGRGGPGFTMDEEIHPELRHDRGGCARPARQQVVA